MDDFELDSSDKNSVLWNKLRLYLQERVATLRELNDNFTTEEETLVTRARILAYKELLNLDDRKADT
jgi:hypothetical protein